MKKLLALLAVLGMVNVASAAITFTVEKGDTTSGTINGALVELDTYYLLVDASSNTSNFNALELQVNGQGNLAVSTGGIGHYSAEAGGGEYRIFNLTSIAAPVFTPTYDLLGMRIVAIPGRSALDMLDPTQYSFGTQSGSPDPGAEGTFFVDSMKVAFAQSGPFDASFNNKIVNYSTATEPTTNGFKYDNQFATIYIAAGSQATATLLGGTGSGGIGSGAQTIGVVSLPEPMTLSVLAIGALGLLRRKHA